MEYWIIVLILLVAISPILTALPSKRSVQQKRLRQKATALGLKVQIKRVAHPLHGQVQAANYGLPAKFPEGKILQTFRFCVKESSDKSGEIAVVGTASAIEQRLLALIQSVFNDQLITDRILFIEVNPYGVAIDWRETGDEQRVATLHQRLTKLVALITTEKLDG